MNAIKVTFSPAYGTTDQSIAIIAFFCIISWLYISATVQKLSASLVYQKLNFLAWGFTSY